MCHIRYDSIISNVNTPSVFYNSKGASSRIGDMELLGFYMMGGRKKGVSYSRNEARGKQAWLIAAFSAKYFVDWK